MKILMIGGSGFVAKALRPALQLHRTEKDPELLIASRNAPALLKGERFVHWDATTPSTLDPVFDFIIHLATPASAELNVHDPALMLEANILTMKNILDFAAKHANPPRLLFTSSGAVYGNISAVPNGIPEDFPTPKVGQSHFTDSAYAEGKRVAESLLIESTLKGKCLGLIARLFAFSGPSLPRDRHFAIGNFVRDAVQQQKIVVRSSGQSIRSYLDETDMAEWLIRILKSGDPLDVFHVGSERAISIRSLAELVASRYTAVTSNHTDVEILGQSSPLDGVDFYVPSTHYTRKKLSLIEKMSLENSIDSMLYAELQKSQI
jgi:dTDP-glucose 4,6-dehydratase